VNIYSCPQCGRSVQRKLKDSALVLCTNCNAKVFGEMEIPAESHGVPDDLSLIQIGSKGKYLSKKFEIVGRIRMQMKDDFRSLWCALYDDDKNPTLWICQSLESIAFAADTFKLFPPKSDIGLEAGGSVVFGDRVKLNVGFVSRPMSIHYEGEIARFPRPDGDFIFVHASNQSNTALVICVNKSLDNTEMLWAQTKELGDVQFENTRKFDEWPR